MKSKTICHDGKVLKSSQFTLALIKEVIFGEKPDIVINHNQSAFQKIKKKKAMRNAIIKKNKKVTMNHNLMIKKKE